jgi:glycosyltransferase involved in cell wall biosynthesis
VPARNEEGAIALVVEELRTFDPELAVVVIDDGSIDATAERAAAAGAAVVRCPSTSASAAPSRRASSTRSTRLRHVIRLDGDGQHDPQEIPNLLARSTADDADVVVGSRFAEGSGRLQASRSRRRPGIRWFAQLVTLLTRQKLTDTTSGLPGRQRPGRSALRRRLSARLPRVEARVMVVATGCASHEVPAEMRGPRDGARRITICAPSTTRSR